MDMSLWVLLGYLGTALYILSYILLNAGKMKGESLSYIGMNGLAAAFVLMSMVEQWNGPSAVIQGTWMLISAFGIAKILLKQRKEKTAQLKAPQ